MKEKQIKKDSKRSNIHKNKKMDFEKSIIDTNNKINIEVKREKKLKETISKLERKIDEESKKYKKIEAERIRFKKLTEEMQASRSWRYLSPIRNITKRLKNTNAKSNDSIIMNDDSGKKNSNSKKINEDKSKKKNLKVESKGKEPKKVKSEKKIKHIEIEGKNYTAKALDNKLLGGFSSFAVKGLEKMKHTEEISIDQRVKAAWSLMRWYYMNDQLEKALDNIDFINIINPRKKPSVPRTISKIRILQLLGRDIEARNIIKDALQHHKDSMDLYLAMSNFQKSKDLDISNELKESKQLKWLNRVFEMKGYAQVKKKNENATLSIDNLTSATIPGTSNEQLEKVSIIIPAFNAEDTIGVAIESLLAQTWRNLEILVVDDLSTDNTKNVVSAYSARDSRVRLIKKNINEGSYSSRNYALNFITGDYITVHDSDDWSHPQKIETMIKALLEKDDKVAIISHWVRVLQDMTVVGSWFLRGSFFEQNFSSLLFHKDILSDLGGWDYIRVSGDSEFVWRIKKIFGEDSIISFEPDVPLSFSLTTQTSLTRTKATHVRTVKFGLRRMYREAAEWWHNNVDSPLDLYIDPNEQTRFFPSPVPNLNRPPQNRHYDLVVVTDFNIQGGAYVSTMNYIYAMLKIGKKVAIFNWRRYDLDVGKALNSKVYKFIFENNIDILVPGEDVVADLMIVGYPTILQEKIDDAPNVNCKNLIVIVNQMANRLYSGEDIQYNPAVAKKNVDEVFGIESKWVPISPLVERLMLEDKRYPTPVNDYWFPMIDTEEWLEQPLRWRGNKSKKPVVGRHSRDHYTKWPSNANEIKQAYGVSNNYEIRLLGGADKAIEVIGYTPKNWEILKFDEIDVKEFLKSLDFFIHYTHDDYIEEFGRSVIEAMSMGIPVILPPKFKETFGDAALYADPGEVSATIDRYWANEKRYLERAKIGRQFVMDNCSIYSFPERISRLKFN